MLVKKFILLLQLLAQICIYLLYRRRQPFCLNDAFNDYALAFGLRMQAFICMQGYLELRDVKPRDQRFFSPSIVGLPATDRKTCLLVSDSTWQCVLVVR